MKCIKYRFAIALDYILYIEYEYLSIFLYYMHCKELQLFHFCHTHMLTCNFYFIFIHIRFL